MIEYGFIKKGVEWGHRMGIHSFSGGRSHTVGPKDKKKFNFKEIREHNSQSYFLGAMEIVQMLMALANEVDKNTPEGQDKFELLLGDMDILYQEAARGVKKFCPNMYIPSIDEIMENKKRFSVSIMDIKDENTKASEQTTSTQTIH